MHPFRVSSSTMVASAEFKLTLRNTNLRRLLILENRRLFGKGTSFPLAKTCCTAVTDTTDAKLADKVIHPSAKVAEEKHTFLPSITSTCPKYFFSSIQRPHNVLSTNAG
uniref:Uncharacterized protein n=1 Tax=Echinococcus canadensis TaxID=519352 RepID=A0A915F003_9CEST